jgi:hypothetical protein
MKNRHPYLVVRGWNKEWNDLMNMEVMLKKHFEAEANGAEVASVAIEGTEAQIIFCNSQGKKNCVSELSRSFRGGCMACLPFYASSLFLVT